MALEKSKMKTRPEPRISVNKLAEYLEANPTRRKQIVSDAKHPKEFIVTRYKDARTVIKNYIMNIDDEDYVLDSITELRGIETETDFQEQDRNLSIDCLESVLETDLTELEDYEIEPFERENKCLNIAGVDVSVNPDLVVRNGEEVGAIKLHLAKASLSPEGQKIVATLLYTYTKEFIVEEGETADPWLCISFDVFNESLEHCPTGVKLRLRRIEDACQEIALWWDKL